MANDWMRVQVEEEKKELNKLLEEKSKNPPLQNESIKKQILFGSGIAFTRDTSVLTRQEDNYKISFSTDYRSDHPYEELRTIDVPNSVPCFVVMEYEDTNNLFSGSIDLIYNGEEIHIYDLCEYLMNDDIESTRMAFDTFEAMKKAIEEMGFQETLGEQSLEDMIDSYGEIDNNDECDQIWDNEER